jgi:hypothetical protein
VQPSSSASLKPLIWQKAALTWVMRPSMSSALMPVSMEFSIARLNCVSWINALWIWARRRMWRQVPSSIHTVSTDSATTIQNKVLLIRPTEVRQPSPRSTTPFSAGVSGTSCTMVPRSRSRPGIGVFVLASGLMSCDSAVMRCRSATSAGTKRQTRSSIEYSATSVPANPLRSISGTCNWNTGRPSASAKAAE